MSFIKQLVYCVNHYSDILGFILKSLLLGIVGFCVVIILQVIWRLL